MAKCCAHGCSSSPITAPLRKFYTLTEVRASLTEWLRVLKRQDIMKKFTIRGKADSFRICDKHFPSLQRTPIRAYSRGTSKVTKSIETQTDGVAPTLMITPVEIVDIQPEFLNNTVPINMPTIIPGQPNVNVVPLSGFLSNITPELQHISNNNVPGFIGNVAPVQTIEVLPGPMFSQKSASAPRMQPNVGPTTPYIINLNGFPATPMFNIIDIPGVSTLTNYVQQRVGSLNVNVPVSNPSVSVPQVEIDDYDIEVREENPINIEDDKTKPQVSDSNSDCDSDIVKLQFPGPSEAQQNEHHVKFEVEETSNDNIETYCFFEDDEVTAKRRRAESEPRDTSFQIVKLELDPDRPIT